MAEYAANTHKYTGHELAAENHARYLRARDAGHKDFVRKAMKNEGFYRGDGQWAAEDTAALAKAGRPACTVNLILPTINTIVGEFMNMQADIQYKPKRGKATEEIAASLSKLSMHLADANDYESLEKEMVEDGLITGRGFLDARIDFSDNVLGEVRYRLCDPREVLPDPTAREYDPSTWNEVITTRWLSLDEIAVIYGEDKADQLRFYSSAGSNFGDDSIKWEERLTYGDNKAFEIGAYDDIETGRTMKEVRIIERQFYRLAKVKEFVDPVNGDTRPVPESWSDDRIALYEQVKGAQVRTKLTRRVRWVVSADCALLHDDWSPYKTFTVIPFFCYFRRGKPFGAVDNLISPQEIVNKIESQVLHVVNTTANSGWIVDSGALANMTVDELQVQGSQTGLVIEKNPGKEIEKITPNSVPTGLDHISTRNIAMVREISGVNSAMLGLEGAEISGVALENKQGRGSLQLETIRANLRRTRKLLARKNLELIQAFYSEERVFYITGYEGDTEELTVNQRDAAGAIANDLTLGEYDVVISSMPARDNFEDSQFAQAIQLREVGVVIPDHRVLQYSGLHRKHEIIEEVKGLTGFGEKTPEQQMMEEAQMKLLLAEVDKAIAEVQNLTANAELASAKAQTELQKPALEREQMQVDMATTQEEQSTRMQVQRLKELSHQLKAMIDSRTQVAVSAQKAKESAATKRKSANGSGSKRR